MLRAQIRESGPNVIAPQPSLAEAALDLVRTGVTNQAEFTRVFGA